jgi:ADP-ribose pyrophosphatase
MTRTIVHVGRKIRVAVEETTDAAGRPVTRDIVMHPGAVAILPMIDADHVCLLRNRRPAVGETLWEIPAGTLEPGEPLDEAALRELAEETGYRAGKLGKLLSFYPSPGVLDEMTDLFLAEQLTPGEQALEAGEEIVAEKVGWDQALRWALDGTIQDAKTLIAILFWDHRRSGKTI